MRYLPILQVSFFSTPPSPFVKDRNQLQEMETIQSLLKDREPFTRNTLSIL